jgi:DNA invertase Pin-like site-specific DNA recombinase
MTEQFAHTLRRNVKSVTLNDLFGAVDLHDSLVIEGVQRAKREGKYKGRAPTARAKSDDIIRLAGEGVKREDIAKRRERLSRLAAERRAAS